MDTERKNFIKGIIGGTLMEVLIQLGGYLDAEDFLDLVEEAGFWIGMTGWRRE